MNECLILMCDKLYSNLATPFYEIKEGILPFKWAIDDFQSLESLYE